MRKPSTRGRPAAKFAVAKAPRQPRMVTQWTRADGMRMESRDCDHCAPGFALPSCTRCHGTGVVSGPLGPS